jgi:multidrug transporter EmrE-like cation transporter
VSLLTYDHLKWASFTHSLIYAGLLTVWLVPGLHGAEMVFGWAHGVGWIIMCILSIVALQRRIISIKLATAVAVIGAIGPFVGSYEFVREERKQRRTQAGGTARYRPGPDGS